MDRHDFGNGDVLCRRGDALILRFGGRRDALSTAPSLGGQRGDLAAVFNHQCRDMSMCAPTYEEHMSRIAELLGLDPETSAGLSTAADLGNAAIAAREHGGVTVTAVATAGADGNGGRAGDPAGWDERDGIVFAAGTINLLLHFNASLSPGALCRALVTATEAKTAALTEVQAPSRYSRGLATGTGTDGIVAVADAESPIHLTEAGKHYKLGEQIGQAVLEAVRMALYRQTGIGPERQKSIWRRLERFGATREALLRRLGGDEAAFVRRDGNGRWVARAAALCHLLDEVDWGMLTPEEAASVDSLERFLEDFGRRGPGASPKPCGPQGR